MTPMAYHGDASTLDGKEVLTWGQMGDATADLARQVVDSGFRPGVVVAIARGGLVAAGALTYALGVKLVDAINVEFYTDVAATLPDPILLSPMLDTHAITDQSILVVDDVADSGRTLQLVIKLLRGFGAEVRSAALYAKPTTVMRPDFVWKDTDRWIVFPWSAEPPLLGGEV
ncbi:MAG TPA: phosphoribosyltransferase [Arachnia sp.]|nr:phosphoribosyltransferase [Arachnia sp.]HMT85187.1 phosphoribosyltransferase [Arachnia sp.]